MAVHDRPGTPVGITDVRVDFDLDTDADEATTSKLIQLTERYCVIAQTLHTPPSVVMSVSQD